MASGEQGPLFLDLHPVDARDFVVGEQDPKEAWLRDKLKEKLAGEGSAGATDQAVGKDDESPAVVRAAERRGAPLAEKSAPPLPLPTVVPMGHVPIPQPVYRCAYCEAFCSKSRPPVHIPVRFLDEGKSCQVRGITCSFPCAAAEIFRQAGGEACGGTALRRDEYMKRAEYLRIMYYVLTGERWTTDWPRTPSPKKFLASYGMGGTGSERDLAEEIARIDPYTAWTKYPPGEGSARDVKRQNEQARAVWLMGRIASRV